MPTVVAHAAAAAASTTTIILVNCFHLFGVARRGATTQRTDHSYELAGASFQVNTHIETCGATHIQMCYFRATRSIAAARPPFTAGGPLCTCSGGGVGSGGAISVKQQKWPVAANGRQARPDATTRLQLFMLNHLWHSQDDWLACCFVVLWASRFLVCMLFSGSFCVLVSFFCLGRLLLLFLPICHN